MAIDVPIRAAGFKYRPLEFILQGIHPLVLRGGLNLKSGDSPIEDRCNERSSEIFHLDLSGEQDRVMGWECIRAKPGYHNLDEQFYSKTLKIDMVCVV